MLNRLKEIIYGSDNFAKIAEAGNSELFFTGLRGSLGSFLVNHLAGKHSKLVYCSNDHTKLFRLKDDINLLAGSEAAMLYISQFDEEFEADISPLSLALRKLSGEEDFILLTTPETLNKSILSEDSFSKNILSVSPGAEIDFEEFVTRLNSYGFTRKKMVEEENDFAVRGGIVDIYPENLRQPVRLEFFGNTVESIREFDLATQRSIAKINGVEILPSVEALDEMQSPHEKLINYLKPDTFILLDEPDLIKKDNEDIYFASVKYQRSYISGFPLVKSEAIGEQDKAGITEIVFEAKSQPAFNSNTRHFTDNLKQLTREGYRIFIS
ncbi:MAG: hypothetical protein JNK43_11825, partial [Ignavibacteria bacterium]|nr:hypothetical protein [Ignavibacteria bacterium]